MDAEEQFASLDGTLIRSETGSTLLWRKPSAIARRSVSIFSRRGTETPEPKPPFFAQAAMRTGTKDVQTPKRWSRRKSAPAETLPKPRGTILNAVPPAKVIQMSPLEEEMATSPNEEILSAINGTPTTPIAFCWPTPTQEQMDSLWNQTHAPLAQRTQSVRQKERNSRIGVWRSGVAHWDDEALHESPCETTAEVRVSTGLSPLPRVSPDTLNRTHTQKPVLSVVIPQGEPLINDKTISTLLQSTRPASMLPLAPANMVPTFNLAAPTPILDSVPTPPSSVQKPSRPPLGRLRASAPPTIGGNAVEMQRLRQLSCSSSSSSLEQDAESDYTGGSSATSLDTLNVETTQQTTSDCAVDSENESSKSSTVVVDKPLPRHPIPSPTRAPPPPPPTSLPPPPPTMRTISEGIRKSNARSTPDLRKHKRAQSSPRKASSSSLPQLDLLDQEFMRQAPDPLYGSILTTPTLSEAEDELMTHLSNLSTPSLPQRTNSAASSVYSTASVAVNETSNETETVLPKSASIYRKSSMRSVMHPPERAPTIPRRSRKRDWRVARNINRAAQLSTRTARRRKSDSNLQRQSLEEDPRKPILRRAPSATELSHITDVARLRHTPIEALLPPAPEIVVDEGLVVLTGPVRVESATLEDVSVSCSAAEDVLLHILASLDNVTDLFNTARINRGMYRVFKENEMDLIQRVTHNLSAPAWEFREWCTPNAADDTQSMDSDVKVQYTPQTYLQAYRRDLQTIAALKRLILQRCQTVIRRETAFALSRPSHPHAQRFDDALWRIWCFCIIFGSNKRREDDVTGQLDWLKGGLLATNQDLTATMNMNLDFDMSSILLNPPDYFAKCNEGGLTAQQLYDMMELWTCMKTLLAGYHYRTEQAWDCGVFSDCGIGIGDYETEADLLEEWTAYLLTLGPKAVLEMAELANDMSAAGFERAKANGWTKWSPPEEHSASRHDFLKEPVSRLYEERVAAAAQRLGDVQEREKKEMSRKRVATLAAEIKLARSSSSFSRQPFINMSMERSMSGASNRSSAPSVAPSPSVSRQGSLLVSPASPPPLPPRRRHRPNSMQPSTSRARSPPRTAAWSPRTISPIIEDRVESFNRLSLQNFGGGVAEDTVERAVTRVVEMGFTQSQALEALRVTDLGSGLRVDRAVDLLLAQQVC